MVVFAFVLAREGDPRKRGFAVRDSPQHTASHWHCHHSRHARLAWTHTALITHHRRAPPGGHPPTRSGAALRVATRAPRGRTRSPHNASERQRPASHPHCPPLSARNRAPSALTSVRGLPTITATGAVSGYSVARATRQGPSRGRGRAEGGRARARFPDRRRSRVSPGASPQRPARRVLEVVPAHSNERRLGDDGLSELRERPAGCQRRSRASPAQTSCAPPASCWPPRSCATR